MTTDEPGRRGEEKRCKRKEKIESRESESVVMEATIPKTQTVRIVSVEFGVLSEEPEVLALIEYLSAMPKGGMRKSALLAAAKRYYDCAAAFIEDSDDAVSVMEYGNDEEIGTTVRKRES